MSLRKRGCTAASAVPTAFSALLHIFFFYAARARGHAGHAARGAERAKEAGKGRQGEKQGAKSRERQQGAGKGAKKQVFFFLTASGASVTEGGGSGATYADVC